MTKWAAIAAMTCCLVLVGVARAGEPEVKLIPGVQVEFEVPGAPPSLADLKRASGAKAARMAVKLPANYQAGRSYPVLVFLSGGDGGTGGELHQAEPFLGSADYILVNLPLFKQDVAGETYDQQVVVTPFDAPRAVPAFRVLLDELRRRVPNIDESRSVLAGFSNGAYGVALILWSGDQDLVSRFGSFVMIEGGFWLTSDRIDVWPDRRFKPATWSVLQGRRVLVMYGDQTQPPDRIPWIKDAEKTVQDLRLAGVNAVAMPMAGVGHDFPAQEMERARTWVLSGR